MHLSLQLTMTCEVCRRKIDSNDSDAYDIAFFGAEPYAVCPCCNQKSPKITAAYKKRCDKYVKEKNESWLIRIAPNE